MFLNQYKKLHRNGSIRLANYDYSRNGYYFITICSKYRDNIFGEIVDGGMKYNEIGNIAKKFWQEISKHFPFVILDEWVIMPDHIHGIIVINKKIISTNAVGACRGMRQQGGNFVMDQQNQNRGMRQQGGNFVMNEQNNNINLWEPNKFGKPRNNSLPMIINHFKGAVTKYTNKNNVPFLWQPRYYEHIIRNECALNNIRRYIRNNPKMWRI